MKTLYGELQRLLYSDRIPAFFRLSRREIVRVRNLSTGEIFELKAGTLEWYLREECADPEKGAGFYDFGRQLAHDSARMVRGMWVFDTRNWSNDKRGY